jgi:hypothetical protein
MSCFIGGGIVAATSSNFWSDFPVMEICTKVQSFPYAQYFLAAASCLPRCPEHTLVAPTGLSSSLGSANFTACFNAAFSTFGVVSTSTRAPLVASWSLDMCLDRISSAATSSRGRTGRWTSSRKSPKYFGLEIFRTITRALQVDSRQGSRFDRTHDSEDLPQSQLDRVLKEVGWC